MKQTKEACVHGVRFGVCVVGLILIAACATPDRGQCLASHEELQPGPPMVMPTGMVVPSGQYKKVQVCDQWEFPDGRPGS